MWGVLWLVVTAVFIMGLVQWARSGAGIWRILSLQRKEEKGDLSGDERKKAEEEVHRLERATDRTLLISFKLIGIMALIVWLVLGASILIQALGLSDWLNDLSMRANRYWSSGMPDRGSHSSQPRRDMLRNIGAGLRK